MKPEFFEAIVERMQKDFGLAIDRSEHPSIVEFFEGPIPLFKLILAEDEENQTFSMLASFQIQLDIPSAIQWFARVRSLDPLVMVTGSYLKDEQGTSHVGQDAETILLHMIEQDVLSAWVESDTDLDDPQEAGLPPVTTPSPVKVYSTYKKALAEFYTVKRTKKDVSH